MNIPPIMIQGRGYIPLTLEIAATHRNREITYFYFDANCPSEHIMEPNFFGQDEDYYANWAGKSSVTIGNDLVIGCANCRSCHGHQKIIKNYFDNPQGYVLQSGEYYFIPSIGDDGVEIDLFITEPNFQGYRTLGLCNGSLWLIVSSPDPNDLSFQN